MNDKKIFFLLLLILLIVGFFQGILDSPLTPKGAAIAHFKINSKLIPKLKVNSSPILLNESEIKDKHGRLELIMLLDKSIIRGVIIEQGDTFIRVETDKGILQILTEKVDTVEIIR